MNTLTPDTLLDITHEALLRNWDKLQQWAYEEHEREIILREMLAQLDKWLKNNRDTQFLLSAGSLSYFEKWWSGIEVNKAMWMRRYLDGGIRADDLADKERKTQNAKQKKQDIEEYLSESRNYHNRKKRLHQIAIGIICVLLVTAVSGLIYSWNLKNKISVISHSNAIATKAYRTLEKDPTLAFRLAEQAYKIAPEPLAKEVLMASYGEMPFYQVLRGHTGPLNNGAKYSPDGKMILSVALDNTIRVWDLNGNEILKIDKHKSISPYGLYNSVNFSPDSKLIASVEDDSSVRLWDLKGKCLATMKHKGKINASIFSHDGTKILSSSGDKTARIWDISTLLNSGWDGKETLLLKHTSGVNIAIFSYDDSEIYTGSRDSILRIFDFHGKLLKEIIGHKKGIKDIKISSDSKFILTCSWDSNAILWNNKTFTKVFIFPKHILYRHSNEISISPDSKLALTTSNDNSARLWDINNGKELVVFRGHSALIWHSIFSPDGRQILTASDDGTARLWDLSGTELMVLKGHTDQVLSANFSPDGNYVVTASGDKTARIWNIKPKENPVLKGHTALILDANISTDGNNIVTAGWDYSARLWKKSGELLNIFDKHKKYAINFSVFVEDGNSFLTSSEFDVYLWSCEGSLLKKLGPHDYNYSFNFKTINKRLVLMCINNNVINLHDTTNKILQNFVESTNGIFSNDGKMFFTLSTDSSIYCWSLKHSNDSILYEQTNNIRINKTIFSSLELSKDCKYLLSASDDSIIRLWSINEIITKTKKLQPFIKLKIPAIISGMKFNQQNTIFAISSNDNFIRLWNINGAPVSQMVGHSDNINDFSFSNSGNFIVSCSKDNTARLWDLNGRELQVFTNHKGGVLKAKFFPDNQYTLTTSYDHTARIMPVSVEMALDKINKEKVRGEVMELSEEELRVFGVSR